MILPSGMLITVMAVILPAGHTSLTTVCAGDSYQVPDWWGKFLTDTAFKGHMYCRWKELRNTTLSIAHLDYLIDSIATLTTLGKGKAFSKMACAWASMFGQTLLPSQLPMKEKYKR